MTELRGSYVAQMMKDRIDDWILSYLPFGRDNAINRFDLLDKLNQRGFNLSERILRDEIERMRDEGQLIGSSSSGTKGGYYQYASYEEAEEFVSRELTPRINKLSHTRKVQLDSAHRKFITAQPSLL